MRSPQRIFIKSAPFFSKNMLKDTQLMQYNTLWCIILHFKPSATSLQPNKLPPHASGKSVIQKRPAEYMFCRTSLNVSEAC